MNIFYGFKWAVSICVVTLILSTVAPSARAAVIYQTNNFSALGNAAQDHVWNQFDPGEVGGTLTGVSFLWTNTTFTGSFVVTNTGVTDITVQNSDASLFNVWNGGGAPFPYGSPEVNPLDTTPTSSGTLIGTNSATTFTLNANPMPDYSTNLFSFAGYFTGTGTISNNLSRVANVTVTGGSYAVDGSLALAQGDMILAYTYTPGAPVPEASTLGAGALLVALAGYVHRRRRAKTA